MKIRWVNFIGIISLIIGTLSNKFNFELGYVIGMMTVGLCLILNLNVYENETKK